MEKPQKKANAFSKPDFKKTRIVHTIDSPFCQISWPTINSTADQNLILEILCTLLSPIGSHRKSHIRPNESKGKRVRKARNRDRAERQKLELDGLSSSPTISTGDLNKHIESTKQTENNEIAKPEISNHILLGLNSITSSLSSSASGAIPLSLSQTCPSNPKNSKNKQLSSYISLIFVTRADSQPSILHQHLPLQTCLSSLNPSQPPERPTLLIPLPSGSSAQLSLALDLPRVSFIGILSSAVEVSLIAGQLEKLCREKVERVRVPWLESYFERGGMGIGYQPMQVKSLCTTIGGRKNKKRKRKGKGEAKDTQEKPKT